MAPYDILPSRSIVTGDIESKIDLKNYVAEARTK